MRAPQISHGAAGIRTLQFGADPNLYWHEASVSTAEREQAHGHRGAVVRFTGLSATGKAKLVQALGRRARAGSIPDFTGISAPYEEPTAPDLVLHTDSIDIAACVEALMHTLNTRGITPARTLSKT